MKNQHWRMQGLQTRPLIMAALQMLVLKSVGERAFVCSDGRHALRPWRDMSKDQEQVFYFGDIWANFKKLRTALFN